MNRSPKPSAADATVLGQTGFERVLIWTGFPLLGGGAGWLLQAVAGWVASLPWAPFQGPFRLVASITDRPLATVGALAVGVAAGLALAYLAERDSVTVAVEPGQISIARAQTTHSVLRASICAVFVDRNELVVLGGATEELVRVGGDLPGTKRLERAFLHHDYPWQPDGDPYRDAYRRWVADFPDMPAGADALFVAREQALQRKDRADTDDLRAELGKLGIVVRDEDDRQYWRPVDKS